MDYLQAKLEQKPRRHERHGMIHQSDRAILAAAVMAIFSSNML